jgi:hypothetical protein
VLSGQTVISALSSVKTVAYARSPFPPPWSVEELAAYFVMRDHNGQQLAYVYFEEEPGGAPQPSF